MIKWKKWKKRHSQFRATDLKACRWTNSPWWKKRGQRKVVVRLVKETKVYLFSHCIGLLSRLLRTPERSFTSFFFLSFFIKQVQKETKHFFSLSTDACESSVEDVAPFLVFRDKLSSASFLGRPARSYNPLDGSSSAAESCIIGWGGGVLRGGGGGLSAGLTQGSAVMNRWVERRVVGSFSSRRFLGGVTLAGDALEILGSALIDGPCTRLLTCIQSRTVFFFFFSLFETTLPRRK